MIFMLKQVTRFVTKLCNMTWNIVLMKYDDLLGNSSITITLLKYLMRI